MRLLIDGYNVMHAAGFMNRRFGPDGLRRARDRFLNRLAMALGPEQARQTTIVFDAASLPISQAPESAHRGIWVVYALEDDDADARIERLIARDSAPRSLTVVSSDRRIRRAALRRRATSLSSDEFLDYLDTLAGRPARNHNDIGNPDEERARLEPPSPEEVEAWAIEFDERCAPIAGNDACERFDPLHFEIDLERIAREVEAEFDLRLGMAPRNPRG